MYVHHRQTLRTRSEPDTPNAHMICNGIFSGNVSTRTPHAPTRGLHTAQAVSSRRFPRVDRVATLTKVTMLHGAAPDTPATETAAAAAADAAAPADAAPAAPKASSPLASPEMQRRIARFNDRNSGRRRSPWQVIEDAPLLLQRLWSDLRRGDTQVFGELIRRGVQLQLVTAALYILSPVSFFVSPPLWERYGLPRGR